MSKDDKLNDDHDETFREFWANLVLNEDGTINLDAVKRELHDFYFMIHEVPKVYSEVTGGLLSKPNYHASSVISAFNDYVERLCEQAVEDYKEDFECRCDEGDHFNDCC